MRPLFTKPLITYIFGIFLLVVITGAIQSTLTDEYIILIAVKGIEFIVLIVMMLHVYDKYLKPIHKSVHAVNELVQGNYRARIHHASQGVMSELSNNINMLARSLSELSIQEEMKTKQLLTVLNNTESGLALVDEKGYIHLVNRKFLSMFGKTHRDYVGYLYYDVLHNEKIHHTVQETFLYEKNVKESFTQAGILGDQHIEIVGAPIFNERNMLKGAVIVLYDITELKKLELMRKDFVANVSHELKTPITSIMGFAETLLDDDKNDEETRQKFLGIIHEESKRLQVLIEDLLTLSTLEKDDFHLTLSNVDFTTILKDIVPIVKYRTDKKNIRFDVIMEDKYSIMADEEKVKQILLNLLVNAVSYTPENGDIVLRIDEDASYVRLNVTDTGIGIARETIPRLFERFYRVDKARSRNTGGTGLGLAIVKHIVEVHGGKITVDSELNKGSSFTVYLPKKNNGSSKHPL